MFFDKQATVLRLTNGTTQTYSGHPFYPNGIFVNVQPASPNLAMANEIGPFKAFKVFAPITASGIWEQDRLIVGPFTYTVVGRQTMDNTLVLPHMEFVCERSAP